MKRITILALVALTILFTIPAHADIFGPRRNMTELSAVETGAPAVDPGTILAEVGAAANYLGVREGTFYDARAREFTNYAAATLYTEPTTKIALDFGAINTDGVALTLDLNVGQWIPAQGVPIASVLQYLYIGGGIDERSLPKSDTDPTSTWKTGYGVDIQFKGTF